MDDTIGQSRPATVEKNQARERCKACQEVGKRLFFPGVLDVRYPPGHEDEIPRSIADHLVGDVNVSAPSVLGLGLHAGAWEGSPTREPRTKSAASSACMIIMLMLAA